MGVIVANTLTFQTKLSRGNPSTFNLIADVDRLGALISLVVVAVPGLDGVCARTGRTQPSYLPADLPHLREPAPDTTTVH